MPEACKNKIHIINAKVFQLRSVLLGLTMPSFEPYQAALWKIDKIFCMQLFLSYLKQTSKNTLSCFFLSPDCKQKTEGQQDNKEIRGVWPHLSSLTTASKSASAGFHNLRSQ